MPQRSAACWHSRMGVLKTTSEPLRASYRPMCNWPSRTMPFASRLRLPCGPQDTGSCEAVASTTERSRLSSFPLIRKKKLIPMLDKLRKKRNIGSYDDFGLVSQGEADHCGKTAVRVRKEVEEWIRKNHGDKIV